MNRGPLASKQPGGELSPGRLRTLSLAILLGRNEWTVCGDAASYRLTARAAELAVVSKLLALPVAEQTEYATWLASESSANLLAVYPEGVR